MVWCLYHSRDEKLMARVDQRMLSQCQLRTLLHSVKKGHTEIECCCYHLCIAKSMGRNQGCDPNSLVWPSIQSDTLENRLCCLRGHLVRSLASTSRTFKPATAENPRGAMELHRHKPDHCIVSTAWSSRTRAHSFSLKKVACMSLVCLWTCS